MRDLQGSGGRLFYRAAEGITFKNTTLVFISMAATKKAGLVVKKKVWIPVYAPKWFGSQFLGEIFATEPQETIGRNMVVNAGALGGESQRQSVNITFHITGLEDNKLTGDIIGMGWLPASVRKLVRRGREKMDDSFTVLTGDGKKLRIKFVMLARSKTTRGVTAQIRRHLHTFVGRTAVSQTYQEFVLSIAQQRLQRSCQDALRKTYPVAICEVRQMLVIGTGTPEEVAAVKATIPAEKPKEQKQEEKTEEPEKAEESKTEAPEAEEADNDAQEVVAEA